MKALFPKVPLRSVLRKVEAPVVIEPEKTYKQVTVRLFHKGVVLRGQQPGAEIRTPRQWRVRAGQILLSRIDARNGAIGIVPADLDGAIVTNDFWALDVDAKIADARFLDAFFGTEEFVEACNRASEGTTNRIRLQLERFLDIAVPLPSLPEQRRIAARIEELSIKIKGARGLRHTSASQRESLERSLIDEVYKSAVEAYGNTPLDQTCLSITDGDHLTPSFTEGGIPFIFVGNVSTGYLHFRGCRFVAQEYFRSLDATRRPSKGDLLYSAVGATLGIPAVVDSGREFCFQRHVAILKPDRSRVSSKFLWYMLRSRSMYTLAWGSVTGSAQPTIPPRGIRAMPVPVPPLDEQCRLVAYLAGLQSRVDALKGLQSETGAELDALLPSILDRAFKGEL